MIALAQQSNILDEVIHGEALAVLRTLPDNSVDAIVCDPPAGIEFMGKEWDAFGEGKRSKGWAIAYDGEKNDKVENNGFYTKMRPSFYNQTRKDRDNFISFITAIMAEALRVLKPGGHAFVWALPRTSHWTGIALEDAGFEIRDVITHLFGSGFPKSHDISAAIDKVAPRKGMFTAFASHLKAQLKDSGMTNTQLGEYFKTSLERINHGGCVTNWVKGYNVPTLEQWRILQPLLSLSDEWLPLIERVEAEREVIGQKKTGDPVAWYAQVERGDGIVDITAPATPEASQWNGWGTALKPSSENWWLCRKPLSEPTIAANVLKWGTGAINIDASRIGTNDNLGRMNKPGDNGWKNSSGGPNRATYDPIAANKRWPANLLLSHSVWCVPNGVKKVRSQSGSNTYTRKAGSGFMNGNGQIGHGYNDAEGMEQVEDWLCDESCPIRLLDEQSKGTRADKASANGLGGWRNQYVGGDTSAYYRGTSYHDQGGASRYFMRFSPFIYQAKASRAERNRGCEGLPEQQVTDADKWAVNDRRSGTARNPTEWKPASQGNNHPTVKSIALCRYLVRLITPPGGIVLDCFAGSGSTLVAAIHEGMHFIGIEMNDTPEEPYISIARARIEQAFREVQS